MENQSSIEQTRTAAAARLVGGKIQIREISSEYTSITGRFPYDTIGRLNPRRREKINPFAFDPLDAGEVHLLAGHDYNRPIARTGDKSLVLDNTRGALSFVAKLPNEKEQTSWMKDTLTAIRLGLIDGISPGFLIRPGGIQLQEDLQIIRAALLRELSIVTRPVYQDAAAHTRHLPQESAAQWNSVL